MKKTRPRHRRRPPSGLTHEGHRAPHSAAASILEHMASDPAHVVAALCQMATLAHVAGRLKKRNDSVEVAAELLARHQRLAPISLGGSRC